MLILEIDLVAARSPRTLKLERLGRAELSEVELLATDSARDTSAT
jgi:hypothetical protein